MPSTASNIDLRVLACEAVYGGHLLSGSDFVSQGICHRCNKHFFDLVALYKSKGLLTGHETFSEAFDVIITSC